MTMILTVVFNNCTDVIMQELSDWEIKLRSYFNKLWLKKIDFH